MDRPEHTIVIIVYNDEITTRAAIESERVKYKPSFYMCTQV